MKMLAAARVGALEGKGAIAAQAEFDDFSAIQTQGGSCQDGIIWLRRCY